MEFEKGNKVLIKNTGDIWEGKKGTVISQEDDIVLVKVNFETEEETKTIIQEFNKENLEMERENESLNENKEELTESVNLTEAKKEEKKDDFIHQYIYLEDLDGKEIPAWNFAARIATAEDIEEGCVCMKAEDLGYKVFAIEAPGFYRTVIAAKGIKAEDIEEEYADFLQGKACVYEIK